MPARFLVIKLFIKYIFYFSISVFLLMTLIAIDIFLYSQTKSEKSADAAVVLGAAAWGSHPSPVYRERLNKAIELYKIKRVRKLIFTGGTKSAYFPSESEVARDYSIHQGVMPYDILIESNSHTTLENLIESKKIIDSNGIDSVLLVSDPIHMKRAMYLAEELHINASAVPCESSKFQSYLAQFKFLMHETWALAEYILLHKLVTAL